MKMDIKNKEVEKQLNEFPEWEVQENGISRTFEFNEHSKAVLFASSCSWVAEKLNHHPTLTIEWRKVNVSIFTHSSNQITELDVKFISEIN